MVYVVWLCVIALCIYISAFSMKTIWIHSLSSTKVANSKKHLIFVDRCRCCFVSDCYSLEKTYPSFALSCSSLSPPFQKSCLLFVIVHFPSFCLNKIQNMQNISIFSICSSYFKSSTNFRYRSIIGKKLTSNSCLAIQIQFPHFALCWWVCSTVLFPFHESRTLKDKLNGVMAHRKQDRISIDSRGLKSQNAYSNFRLF